MTRDEFDNYCKCLKSTTHVVQWGNASVWKVGGKIFAICPLADGSGFDRVSFKCSDHSFQVLCELPGVIPAPYLARGKWVQVTSGETLSDDDIKSYLEEAHAIIAAKLTKAKRAELGLG